MAQAPAPIGIAPRYMKPATFGGTDVSWRVLCDLYPSAETPEVIQAVVEYCAARKLDPLRKPVHIVPIYNARLKRRVQVVMQGINELETTAHRTKKFAGNDEADYGPDETKTFRGTVEDESGRKQAVEVTLTYPVSAAVKVYRLVQGERVGFVERVFFAECYGRAGFRSEVPNARWTLAPRQMLAKVAKAASLRLAFPEEVGEYTAEEMDGQTIETGGVTIDGTVDHGDPGLTDRDRRIAQTPPAQPPGEARTGIELLDEAHGGQWLKNLQGLLDAAETLAEVDTYRRHRSVQASLAKDARTPTLIRSTIVMAFQKADERILAALPPADDELPPDDVKDWPTTDLPLAEPSLDRLAELKAEVEAMDAATLAGLQTNAAWRQKVRDADLFPPDEDDLNDFIADRRRTTGRT